MCSQCRASWIGLIFGCCRPPGWQAGSPEAGWSPWPLASVKKKVLTAKGAWSAFDTFLAPEFQ
jgi:hypothetical protein